MKSILSALEIEIENEEKFDEDHLREILKTRINDLLENNPGFLFSLMYRLDISEGKVRYALSPFCEEEPALALANLIINRQKQRNLSKSEYKQPPLEDEDAYQ